jgi:hypothetical protein
MVESLAYEVVKSFGDLEIRKYPHMILATVSGVDDDESFSLLFSYISGANSRDAKVPMTIPVVSADGPAERIPMTIPVISDSRRFSFILPSRYALDDVPAPKDRRIKIEALPGRHVATLRFRGRAGEQDVRVMTQRLLLVLRHAGLRHKGAPFLLRYNSPFRPGFLRRNEVGVEIERPL